MKKITVVIDMQNDFLTGSLANTDAVSIIPSVLEEIKSADFVVYTRDTHGSNYSDTREGKKLPVPHCIEGTWGWQIGDYLGLPYDLVHKVPMDGLNLNENDEYITDEDVMGIKYSDIHMYAREPEVLSVSNPEVFEAIRQKEKKNAFKLKPMPTYNPDRSLIYKI